MKHLKNILFISIIAVLAGKSQLSIAQNTPADTLKHSVAAESIDSVEISLLTCGPGDEVYSLYGHTAIRYVHRGRRQDLTVNYGVFSFKQEFFILRFVFGLTDYEMGIYPTSLFLKEYQEEHRWVRQQVLNLTREEKLAITQALDENYRPENRTYRYNYFYDNCTTRARDIILAHLRGKTVPMPFEDNTLAEVPTYRKLIHKYNETRPWARFGNDILLGVGADRELDEAQQEFLPENLMNDFAQLAVNRAGRTEALVSSTKWLIAPADTDTDEAPILRPSVCAFILLIITFILSLVGLRYHIRMWVFDGVLMLLCGLAGIILFAMIFSQHPTVSLNLQLLLLNPLPLFFLYPAIKRERHHRSYWYWKLALVLIILFFIGGFFQSYAEGMTILALSLLIRTLVNLKRHKKHSTHHRA